MSLLTDGISLYYNSSFIFVQLKDLFSQKSKHKQQAKNSREREKQTEMRTFPAPIISLLASLYAGYHNNIVT